MILQRIPTDSQSPWYSQTVPLSGVRYTLELRLNTRANRWAMDIGDAANTVLVAGVPLLINRNLLASYPGRGLPVGALFVTDETGQEEQPVAGSFARSHVLWYADPTQ